MYKFIKISFINLIILIFLIEFLSFILIKINFLPNGMPTSIILNADEKFSYWHPKNISLKIATKCWQSKVRFNSIGIKSNKEFEFTKKKKRIAILGDSMTENAQLNNEKDFAFKLQNLMPDFEIINFSISSTGLADHINIYNRLIKKYNVDYIFYYVTFNDFSDNHLSKIRPMRMAYEIKDNKVLEVNSNKTSFFQKYNSPWNKFKREKLIYIKKSLNFYKLYYYMRWELEIFRFNNQEKKIKKDKYKEDILFNERKKVYQYLVRKADNEIFSNTPTLIFMNSDNVNFIRERKEIVALKEIYKNYNFFDPREEFIAYLKNNNNLKSPYLGYSCDAHYSELGAELLAKFTLEKFLTLNQSLK